MFQAVVERQFEGLFRLRRKFGDGFGDKFIGIPGYDFVPRIALAGIDTLKDYALLGDFHIFLVAGNDSLMLDIVQAAVLRTLI